VRLYYIGAWGLYYIIYRPNIFPFVITPSVCHCQSGPPLSNICGQGLELTLAESHQGFHLGRLHPFFFFRIIKVRLVRNIEDSISVAHTLKSLVKGKRFMRFE